MKSTFTQPRLKKIITPELTGSRRTQNSHSFKVPSILNSRAGYYFILLFLFSILIRCTTNASFSILLTLYLTQLIYEISLLKHVLKIRHQKAKNGQILFYLFLILLSSCDITMIQSSLSFYCFRKKLTWLALLFTGFYLCLNLLKIVVIMDKFDIRRRMPELLSGLTLLATITLIIPIHAFFPANPALGANPFAIYFLLLFASGCLLPTIASNWNRSEQRLYRLNDYLKNELNFYFPLIIVPTLLLPIQLFACSKLLANSNITNLISMIQYSIPLLLSLSFFIQIFIRNFLDDNNLLSHYDFFCFLGILLLACTASIYHADHDLTSINKVILACAFLTSTIFRKNYLNVSFIVANLLSLSVAITLGRFIQMPGIIIAWIGICCIAFAIAHRLIKA